MYDATRKVLQYICGRCSNGRSQADARGACKKLVSFKFIFILHLMHRIMRISDVLCQAFQRRSQDILTALRFVSTTKQLLQKLRDDNWEEFLQEVKSFCSKNNITIPDLEGLYNTGRSSDETTIEHYYHYDVFNEAIDFVIMDLNTRFNDILVELLSFSAALDPKDSFRSFDIPKICTLAEKFYPQDFSKEDIITLEYELPHYELDMKGESRFQVSTLSELFKQLIESGRSEIYIMMIRLIRLVLTLPVSIASTERAFSAMKHVKTTLRNKMGDDFLADCMILFIERELVEKIDLDSIIDEYYVSNPRRE
ncbi:uncharacterized protein LOC111380583 [Olea europaea var. sylvestris]|uniref:uncharacterized protein LOC111380583 n=1 Tax=Olea europaea var. sylvestris TaxID=158386 RepID=UPI000C1D2963|nr:uncharacterized protein LOC111380583 [Olea europaea var. sylvestris]